MPRLVVALIAGLVLAATACQSREVGTAKRASASSASTVVFEDDFERDELGEKWTRGSGEGGRGQWTIAEGRVTASAIRNDPLWLQVELPERVRVEFDAEALTPVGDIKVEIFGDGTRHESGYILIFGGWNNSLDVIARLDEHGEDRLARRTRGVEPNRVYRMAVERTDGALRWYVDGELFMTYEDEEPLRGRGHRYFAFNNWDAGVRFDNVRVLALE